MAMGETYEEFIAKFDKNKAKTTDDCYTPRAVYETVQQYVEDMYGIPKSKMIRPFYPGGDYENEIYPEGCCVVDNPPFSILQKIINFYYDHNIKFFMFAPGLTLADFGRFRTSQIFVKSTAGAIVYDNGAKVQTSFVTNLDERPAIWRDDYLTEELEKCQNIKSRKKNVVPPDAIYAAGIKTKGGFYYLDQLEKHPDNKHIFGQSYILKTPH